MKESLSCNWANTRGFTVYLCELNTDSSSSLSGRASSGSMMGMPSRTGYLLPHWSQISRSSCSRTETLHAGHARTDDHLPLKPVVFHILLALAAGDAHGYGVIQAVREGSVGRIRLALVADPAVTRTALTRLRDCLMSAPEGETSGGAYGGP